LKIVLAHKYFHPGGGPETVMFQSLRVLNSLGHEIIPFSMKHPLNLKTPYSKYFVSEVDYNNHKKAILTKLKTAINLIYSVEAQKKMEKLINDTCPQIAHLHNIYHQISPSILRTLKKHGIPVVMTLHDFKLACPNYTFLKNGAPCEICEGKHFYKAVINRCVKNSFVYSFLGALEMYLHKLLNLYTRYVDVFIVLSRFSKEKMIKYGLPEEKIEILPNSIDVNQYLPPQQPAEYILFLGRLSEKNGIFTLVQAMKHIPKVKLKIAGEGEMGPFLKEYASREGLENVEFLGFVTGEKLQRLIQGCYFTVFPALCYHNCPMSILESQAFGRPVLASNLGSIPEFVQNGLDGLCFNPGDVEDLREKIKYLYQKPLLVEKMGLAGYEKVKRDFSTERYYSELIKIYQDLLKGGELENHRCHRSGYQPLQFGMPEVQHLAATG
jgi:glycosyltransferase involved in cell wall biosynthesis